jgi:hypothetical protein
MTAKLKLHLKLDGFQVENSLNLVEDFSGNNHTGTLFGDADIVADDALGACADFDGNAKSYIKVPSTQPLKITGDVTIEAWVNITKAAKGWVRVIGKGTVDTRTYGLWYIITGTGTTWLFQRGPGKPFHDCKAVSPTTLNTWYHLSGVVEGKKSFLYVHDLKGKLIVRGDLDKMPSGPVIDNDSAVTIGYGMMDSAHCGKIAHARIYNGALSLAEIERDINSDRLALVPFRKSHPIDFRLSDEDDQPALYIVDDSANAKTGLKLELTNSATQTIRIPPPAPATDANHHHFALRFRPGTLSASTIKKLRALRPSNQVTVLNQTDADHWELACVEGLTGPVTLYASYKGRKNGQGDKNGKLFLPEEQLTLTLHGISADAGSGSRGTQVELIPHQLTYEGDDTPITGSRMRYIHITNHRGQKNIPLHVWFVNGNTVLNDGKSTTTLKLRISNGSGDRDITLNERSSQEASKFVISFEVGEAEKADWALTEPENAKKLKVKRGGSELTKIDRGQGASGTFEEWELTFPEKTVLAKRGSGSSEHVELALEGITTALSSGHANLYVRYEGIPGYQDGQFILTVEKSPLVFDKKDEKGKWDGAKWNTFEGLSIRVGNPSAKPPTLRPALLINGKGNVGIGTGTLMPEAKLEIALEDKDATTNSLVVRKGATNYLTMGNDGNLQIGDFGPALGERYLKIAAGAETSPSCRTGIKLELGQHNEGYSIALIRHQGTYGLRFDADRHPGSYEVPRMAQQSYGVRGPDLFLDFYTGHIGIGTDTPEEMLDVRGGLQVRELTAKPTPDLAAFYDKDKLQGIGIGYNQIASIGNYAKQDIFIRPKPEGALQVEGTLQVNGTLRVNGLPIFGLGGRMSRGQQQDYAQKLKDPSYPAGSFIFFLREDESDDPCCLVKKPNDEVILITLYRSGKPEKM